MEDEKKTEREVAPNGEQTDKPLAVQVVNAVIDGAAAIAKSVVMDTAKRVARETEKTDIGKAAVGLAKKAQKATPVAAKKIAPKKAAAKKAAEKKAATKKIAARNSKPAAKRIHSKRAPAKKTVKKPATKAPRKFARKTAKTTKR
jgi:hypothetical protein